MDHHEHDEGDGGVPSSFEFTQENVDRLKKKYSTEMKDDAGNPIKVCMKLVFQAAIEKDPGRRNEMSLELSQYLTRSDGVINLFLALVDFDTSSERVTTHNQRFLAVAKIITLLPRLRIPYRDYCANISRQLMPLLIHPNTLYSSLAAIIIKALLESPHARVSHEVADVVIGPLLAPLTRLTDASSTGFQISHTILAIHNLTQNHVPTRLFVEQFSNLFYCLMALQDTPSQLKAYLRDSLTEILNQLPAGAACCQLDETIFHDCDTANKFQMVTGDDEIVVEFCERPSHEDPPIRSSAVAEKLTIELLQLCDNQHLVMEFFFHFQAKMWTSNEEAIARRCANLIEPLLSQTIEETDGVDQSEHKLDISSYIMADSSKACELISKTLEHYLTFLRVHLAESDGPQAESSTWASEAQDLAESSLAICLNILQVLCSTAASVNETVVTQSGRTLPTLREIKSILTSSTRSKHANSPKLVHSLDSLIEELTRGLGGGGRPNQTSCDDADCERAHSKREHQLILRDLNDKLVPVRVHALVRLKQLLMASDAYTIEQIAQLYPMVESSLADQEPYVFLASINLLAEMALRRTGDILPRLIALHTGAPGTSGGLGLQQRLNVGEVLVRLTRQLNATTPHYGGQILSALLAAAEHDSEDLIRVSCLANIGTVCSQLGASLGKYIVDILATIRAVLDPTAASESSSLQVKCAAVDLLRTTLMGLERRNVETIQRDLKSIYALLKGLARRTLDEKLCLQVDLALAEIGRLAKDIMRGSEQQHPVLVKNIRVLSLD